MLYDEGIVTEQNNLVRIPPRRWPWDQEHYRFHLVEGYKNLDLVVVEDKK